MAKSTVWIRSEGVNYYLSGGGPGQTAYAGSGTPWTAESTTPYELAYESAPSYVTTAAPGALVTSPGGAFAWGASLVGAGYDRVTESIGVQCTATTNDHAIFLVRQLQQILTSGRRTYNPTLAVQGGTNAAYFEILWGDVALSPDTPLLPAGALFVTLTIVRQPHGMPATPTTLLNGVTFTNNDTAISLGALTGDLLSEGQPLDLDMYGGQLGDGVAGQRRIYAASVVSARSNATGGTSLVTSSTSAQTAVAVGDTVATPSFGAGTHLRALIRIASPSANLEVRAQWQTNQTPLTHGPWVRSTGTQTQLIDLGPLTLSGGMQTFLAAAVTPHVGWVLEFRSGDGSATSGTANRAVWLEAYTFCLLQTESESTLAPGMGGTQRWVISETKVRDGAARRLVPPVCGMTDGGTAFTLTAPVVLRGTPPRAYAGAAVWLAWQRMNAAHSATDTATVTVRHAPLYRMVRGGG